MLGSTLSFDAASLINTGSQALQTTQDVLPAVSVMAKDYERFSPKLNFLMDYWPITLAVLFLTMTGGAFTGSYMVMKRIRRDR
jgi:hypothetical protein